MEVCRGVCSFSSVPGALEPEFVCVNEPDSGDDPGPQVRSKFTTPEIPTPSICPNFDREAGEGEKRWGRSLIRVVASTGEPVFHWMLSGMPEPSGGGGDLIVRRRSERIHNS